jgi:hypothetical protein
MAGSYKWETGRSMHVGQACAHGPTDTTDCATAVDRSDESEPTTWKLIHFVIELFKEGLLKKKWRDVRDAANEEGVGSTETRLSSDLPIGCLKQANVPKHHPEGA